MFSSYQLIKKYIHYYKNAFNGKGHGMHSPFVFDFILHVLNNSNYYTPPAEIEALRNELLKDSTLLQIEDLGAGSRVSSTKKRTVKQIAKSAVKPKKYSQLLYRLVKHYQPVNVIELGTSLGISTAYMAAANPEAEIITIEGSSAIQHVAQKGFQNLSLHNIKSLQGNFDDVLPTVISQLSSVSLAYVDGNHRLQPTLAYFEQLLQKCNNDSILIFDDIHWSEEMEEAWKQIQQHPAVQCTVDVFFLGFVFFRKEFKIKQHFSVHF